jgi:hypothetical protein
MPASAVSTDGLLLLCLFVVGVFRRSVLDSLVAFLFHPSAYWNFVYVTVSWFLVEV